MYTDVYLAYRKNVCLKLVLIPQPVNSSLEFAILSFVHQLTCALISATACCMNLVETTADLLGPVFLPIASFP